DMSGAYKNIGAIYKGVNFVNGKIDNASPLQNVVHSGDELYIVDSGLDGNDCIGSSSTSISKIWAVSKDHLTFTNSLSESPFVFVDRSGGLYNRSNVTVKIVRSGYRNLLDGSVGSVELMENPIKTDGGITKLVINNSSKVLNAGAIEYKQRWLVDNDVIRKLKLETIDCVEREVLDCENGYLEKSINPYTKGLIGNYRANKKYVYYSERNNETVGDRRSAGLFSEFKLMWNFDDSDSKFKQDLSNAKWVWQTESTKFNKRGFELENINALGIYSSALYGYNKILPVATASNTKYNELWYEGFEDYGFKSAMNEINWSNSICEDRALKLDLLNQANASIVTNSAHTGKAALKLNAGTTMTNSLNLVNLKNPYELRVDSKSNSRIISPYGNKVTIITSNSNLYLNPPPTIVSKYLETNPSYDGLSMDIQIQGVCGLENKNGDYNIKTEFYIEIKEDRLYKFNFFKYTPSSIDLIADYFTILYEIRNQNGSIIYPNNSYVYTRQESPSEIRKTADYCLKKGIYKVELLLYGSAIFLCTNHDNILLHNPIPVLPDRFAFYEDGSTKTVNNDLHIFKSDSVSVICSYNSPISSSSSMLNGILEIPKDKRMVISGWVKEDCGN
ncbi:hypothetical protein, partial [Polluticaenibacter yanchengensis]|nr:hypothetical protein [Chitinophagaceae bacterium LY-5]